MAAYGDIDFNIFGAFLCFVGCFLAALKSVLSNKFLSGTYSLHPFDLLNRVAPLAFLQLLPLSIFAGEAEALSRNWQTYLNIHDISLILGSAVLSLLLNWVSFEVCKVTSALTMSLAGIVRDTLTVPLSVAIFGNVITTVNAAGICLALAGSACYSHVSYLEMSRPPVTARSGEVDSVCPPPSGRSGRADTTSNGQLIDWRLIVRKMSTGTTCAQTLTGFRRSFSRGPTDFKEPPQPHVADQRSASPFVRRVRLDGRTSPVYNGVV
eukprot:CAMPEP_0196662600 /NCGR_PEP_ID=MMETSP1086-20130531/49493_1 /TAXON_ID=77921 /ORGANISM="Cyanoptyche  gloeocystis , Strain SAG4.97" /LENGTH=265 /DNA_ID=CAMNT_0041998075 /DNA_START=529 /DNA_END=1326 /DNA_ORIENTATION=+